jgi:hypothetical protein
MIFGEGSITRTRRLLVVVFGVCVFGSGVALAASPVTGFVSGQVTSVTDGHFAVKASFGPITSSTVSLGATSSIIQTVTVARSALKDGTCVVANGTKTSSGVIDASRITLSVAVKGSCSSGFSDFGHRSGLTGPGGGYPHGGYPGASGTSSAGGTPPSASLDRFSFGDFGFAAGPITALTGSELTVKGSSGSTKVALSTSTQLTETKTAPRSAITVGECVTVRGTSTTDGATVTVTSISLSMPTSDGCSRGFGRP